MLLLNIIQTEWRNLWRNRVIVWLIGLLMALSIFTIWQTTRSFTRAHEQRLSAIQHMRQKFTGQGAVNPHSAAHYGHFVYKPMNILSVIDEGVNPFTGITLRLEAHRQNDALFAPSQSSSSLVRFGELQLNLLLQVLLPLLILFACYNSISAERENGTLKLTISQGITLRQLIWGKAIAYTALWCAMLLVTIGMLALAIYSVGEQFSSGRLLAMLLLYSIYYFIVTALSVYVSARSKISGNALLLLLSAWLLCTVLLPKATANIGENMHPLITRVEMERRIKEDNKQGINGHDPQDERVKRFEDSVLKKYGVDTVSKLPINVDGLTMQADEEYHNTVYDKHFGEVQATVQQQNNITAASSFINPFAAVRNLSMALAGTDVYHHFDFMGKAEGFRRTLIRKLNTDMAYGGSKTGDWDWAVKPEYWQAINDFNYVLPAAGWSLQQHIYELIALVCWLAATVLFIQFTTKHISVI